jgi:ABC-type lipoprotein release transport system permease subunit
MTIVDHLRTAGNLQLDQMGKGTIVGIQFNTNHILRSLCYFEDAEEEPMPNMIAACDWQEVKEYFMNEVKRLSRIL